MVFLSRSVFFLRSLHKTFQLHKSVPYLLADIGEGITEVQIVQWHVKEGSKIRQFDKLAEVQSDKATVEITSRYDGVVKKLHYSVNDMAKVGEPLVDIETDGVMDAHATTKEPTSTEAKTDKSSLQDHKHKSSSNDKAKMMPSVRHMVNKQNIDLSRVQPTGKDGRYTKEDVLSATERGNESSRIDPPASTAEFYEIAMNPVRKAMIKAMEASLQIPHFGYSDEVRFDALLEAREQYSRVTDNEKISLLPFIIKATSLALEEYPSVNAHFLDGRLMASRRHHIAVAIDTPLGLVVPVVKDVQGLRVPEIHKILLDLIDRARRNSLRKDDFQGATFTISNIGSIGGTYVSPVIVAPQVCILAVGRSRHLPILSSHNGGWEAQRFAAFSFSADHRAVDGATIARFSNHIKSRLESPLSLII